MTEPKLVVIKMVIIVKEYEHKTPNYLKTSDQVFFWFPDSSYESFGTVHSW